MPANICLEKTKPFRYPEIDLITNKTYGANHIIRQYIDWPQDIPLPITIPHDFKVDFILSNIWVERQTFLDLIIERKQIGEKYMHKCGHAILYLPEIKEQEKQKKQGTLAFPKHPSYSGKFLYSSQLYYELFDKYCQDFIKLPDKFHPLTICLFKTMKSKCIPICEKYKINYVTSGEKDIFFYERLRNLMIKYEYITGPTGLPMWFTSHWGCKFFYYSGIKGLDHKPPEKYVSTFTLENADNSLELQKKLHPNDFPFLGKEFKKTKEEILKLMEECKKDIRYQFCMSIYEKNGKNINAIREHI